MQALIGVIVERTTAAQQNMSTMQEEVQLMCFYCWKCHGSLAAKTTFQPRANMLKESHSFTQKWQKSQKGCKGFHTKMQNWLSAFSYINASS